jgi:peptidyl-tRNA hydrolase, PTH1 family
MSEISIVCGLGNPGMRYRKTRHNLGYMVLDCLAVRHSLSWKRVAGPSMEASWRVGGRSVALAKPLLFMNASGVALVRRARADADNLLVVCDDLSIPLGRLRFRTGGGSGGHKGLESIIAELGTERFPRLRLGIGPSPAGSDWVDYVLSDFEEHERSTVSGMIESAADAVETALRGGLDAAMTRYNGPGQATTSP